MLHSFAYADVAQLVEHHLAKVRVAGSNPVVRSNEMPGQRPSMEGLFSFSTLASYRSAITTAHWERRLTPRLDLDAAAAPGTESAPGKPNRGNGRTSPLAETEASWQGSGGIYPLRDGAWRIDIELPQTRSPGADAA